MAYSNNKKAFCCAFDCDLYSELSEYSKNINASMASVVNIAVEKYLHSDSVSLSEFLSDIRECKNILKNISWNVKHVKL